MCLLWVVAKFSPLASMVVVGMNACGPSPIPPFHLKQDLQEEEKLKSWDLPRTWQLATHRICRNTFHLCLHLRFRFRLRLCLPLHSQDSLKQEFFHDESHVLIFISHVVGHRGHVVHHGVGHGVSQL